MRIIKWWWFAPVLLLCMAGPAIAQFSEATLVVWPPEDHRVAKVVFSEQPGRFAAIKDNMPAPIRKIKLDGGGVAAIVSGHVGDIVMLLFIPHDEESDIEMYPVDLSGAGPVPAPDPPPLPPEPDPVPAPAGQRWIVVLHETSDLSPEAAALRQTLAAESVTKHLRDKKHRWRFVDKDILNENDEQPKWMAPYLKRVAKEGHELPVLFICAPGSGDNDPAWLYEGSPALDADSFLKLITKHGG